MRALSEAEKAEVINRLFQFSYMAGADWKDVRDLLMTDEVIKQAVVAYRDFNGLTPGDQIDEELLIQISKPRCSVPDFARSSNANLCQWPKTMARVTLAHRLEGLNPLSAEVERDLVKQACAAWNAVCGINLVVIDDMNSANIYSQVGSTGAGVLAYSFLPCGANANSRMQQVYSQSTNWNKNILLQVLIHEIGHAIGLDHGPNGALMQPTANGAILKPQAWDIQQAVARYGNPKPAPAPDPQDPQVPTPMPGGTVVGRIVLASDMKKGDTLIVTAGSDGSEWGMG